MNSVTQKEMQRVWDKVLTHWEYDVLGSLKKGRLGAIGAASCELCITFRYKLCLSCDACPIGKATGGRHCDNSPFEAVKLIWTRFRYAREGITREAYGQDFIAYEQAVLCELEFLTLLSQGETEAAMECIKWMRNYLI